MESLKNYLLRKAREARFMPPSRRHFIHVRKKWCKERTQYLVIMVCFKNVITRVVLRDTPNDTPESGIYS